MEIVLKEDGFDSTGNKLVIRPGAISTSIKITYWRDGDAAPETVAITVDSAELIMALNSIPKREKI